MFLIVTRSFPPEVGGMQILMKGLSESLVEHGPVKVFANEFPDSHKYDKNSPLDVERIKGIKLFRKYRKANIVNDFISNHSNIRAIFVDHWKSLELLNSNILKKTKTFCLLHSKEINHEINSSTNKRLIKSTNKANFIIANSNFTKDLAVRVGIDKSKIHIIFPGIPKPKKIDALSLDEAKKIFADSFPKIITVSRLEKRKGHDKILMLIKNLKVKYPKIKYISIGFGEEEKKLQALSKELFIENEVLFLKNINENFKLALIAESDLFLMPSRKEKKSVEGFGIAFMEAASYGTPSIGGSYGGASDAISHNKTGLICNGDELSSIHDAVNNILDDKKFKIFGDSAKKFSESFYWNKIVKKYLNLIN